MRNYHKIFYCYLLTLVGAFFLAVAVLATGPLFFASSPPRAETSTVKRVGLWDTTDLR